MKDYFHRGDSAEPLERSEVLRWAAKLLARRGVTMTRREGLRTLANLALSSRPYYWCSTLCLPDDSRLTIDQGLMLAGAEEVSGLKFPEVAIETKPSGRTSDADQWLWSCGIQPSRASKCATGTAIIHPEPPANRWYSTMTKLGIRR